MSNFWKLLKVSLRYNLFGSKPKSMGKIRGTIIAFVCIFLYLAGFLSFSYYGIATSYAAVGQAQFVVSYGSLISAFFILLTCISGFVNVMYRSKDSEMLLAMPVGQFTIVASKFCAMLVMAYFIQLFCLLPAIVIYFVVAGISVVKVIVAIFGFLLLPILPVALSLLLSALFTLIISKSKRKNLMSILGLFAFLVVFLVLYYVLGIFTPSASGVTVGPGVIAITKYFINSTWFAETISGVSYLSILYIILDSLVGLAVALWFANVTFLPLYSASKNMSGVTKRVKIESKSQLSTLIKKESKKYFSTPMWVFNSSVGLILLSIGAIVVAFLNVDITSLMTSFGEPVIVLIASFAFCAASSMSNTTCVSISLEGSKLELLRSMPVSAGKLYLSKIIFNIILVLPFITFSTLLLGIVYKISFLGIVLVLLMPILFLVLTSIFGLWVNLKLPKLDAANDTVVIKQSLSSVLGITPFILPVLLISVYLSSFMTIISPYLFYAISCVAITAIATVFGLLVYKKRQVYFNKLFA